MAKRNSITIIAEAVEVSKGIDGVVAKIRNPSEDDLIRLIVECSSILEWRRNRSELSGGDKK
jgi:hypothetical protein